MGRARIAVVLGGGGQVGIAFHAAVLQAISETTGWDPRQASLIVGTSAGSITGAMLRAGFSVADLAARATGRPLTPEGASLAARVGLGGPRPATPTRPALGRTGQRRIASVERLARAWRAPWRATPGSLLAAMLPEGRIALQPLTEPLHALFGQHWPDDPYWAIAVDLDRGARVAFGSPGAPPATVAEAVAASCAIPAFFEPARIGGRRYVDGGVHSATNADLAARLDGDPPDLVIVSAPMSVARGVRLPVDQAFRQAVGMQVVREVSGLRRRGIPTIAFQPGTAELEVMRGNALDPAKMPAVFERVEAATRRRLARPDQLTRLEILRG